MTAKRCFHVQRLRVDTGSSIEVARLRNFDLFEPYSRALHRSRRGLRQRRRISWSNENGFFLYDNFFLGLRLGRNFPDIDHWRLIPIFSLNRRRISTQRYSSSRHFSSTLLRTILFRCNISDNTFLAILSIHSWLFITYRSYIRLLVAMTVNFYIGFVIDWMELGYRSAVRNVLGVSEGIGAVSERVGMGWKSTVVAACGSSAGAENVDCSLQGWALFLSYFSSSSAFFQSLVDIGIRSNILRELCGTCIRSEVSLHSQQLIFFLECTHLGDQMFVGAVLDG